MNVFSILNAFSKKFEMLESFDHSQFLESGTYLKDSPRNAQL